MRILVTGSSGWLGRTLVPRLSAAGHQVIGLDPVPSRHTQIVGTVTDRESVRRAIRDFEADAIVHAAALHKPNIETHPALDNSAFGFERDPFSLSQWEPPCSLQRRAGCWGGEFSRWDMTTS